MKKLISNWSSLDRRNKALTGVVGALVLISLFVIGKSAMSPSLSLLFGGLEPRSASEIISDLEQRGIVYEVRGSDIFVPANQRDELRMALAGDGLPANTTQGYELLDSLSGFGTTSQMFDAAYWRAKEGELARTIVTNERISSARVHISKSSSTGFRKENPPTASVSIISSGGSISEKQARAIRFLVASAVSEMQPEDVTVIDSREGVVGSPDTATSMANSDDHSRLMRERIQRLLEARVGLGNAVVEVSVETAGETETIQERIFDPNTRVAISTDTEERTTQSQNSGRPSVTVASNLPDGDASGTENSTNQDSETRERVNYEVSETKREIVRQPGTIKRISVAVLINNVQSLDASGEIALSPREEEELASLRELVQSAIGFDADRGDVVTLKSLPFLTQEERGSLPNQSFWGANTLDPNKLIQVAVLAVVSLVLGLFVLRPMFAKSQTLPSDRPELLLNSQDATTEPQRNDAFISATSETSAGEIVPPESLEIGREAALPDLANPSAAPVERLRALIADRQDETVQILRNWMEDKEEENL